MTGDPQRHVRFVSDKAAIEQELEDLLDRPFHSLTDDERERMTELGLRLDRLEGLEQEPDPRRPQTLPGVTHSE